MTRIIREYHVKPGEGKFNIPFGSKILSFGMDSGVPTIWVLVNKDVEVLQTVYTLIHETGEAVCDMAEFYNFLGTTRDDNNLAWHCFYLKQTKQ